MRGGEDALDGDAETGVPGDACPQMSNRAHRLFVRVDLDEGEPGVVIDGDVDIFPAIAAGFAGARGRLPPAVTGDAVANLLKTPEFF